MADQLGQDEGIAAYHGSPHDFDQFDLSRIGSGQGEQAYGHGLYFASAEDLAKSYRDDLSSNRQMLDDRPVADLAREGLMAREATPDQEIARFVNQYGRTARNVMAVSAPHLVDRYDELIGGERLKPAGKMYEVRINAHPDNIMDWDRPIFDQPNIMKMLQDQHDNLDPEHEKFQFLDFAHKSLMNEKSNGSHAHYYLKQVLGNKGASDYLNGMGIKGIKYLDTGSRGVGEGTQNYVIFDDSLVNVARKYRRGGAVDGYAGGGRAFRKSMESFLNSSLPADYMSRMPQPRQIVPDIEKPAPTANRDSKVESAPHSSTMDNGKPITFYHGANERHDKILPDKKEPGAWFTTNLNNAANYARGDDAWVHSVNLTPKNPMVVVFDYDKDGKIFATHEGKILPHTNNVDIVNYAKENGFDSVHFPRGNFTESDNTYVVFNPEDIKIIDDPLFAYGGAVDGYADGGSIDDETPYHQTPEFKNWFGNSVTHNDGIPITYYHGTSKDKDFPSFNVGRHGVWLTDDPNEASGYAAENDSQDFRYEDGRYVKTNTASRVIPVHLKAEKPFTGPMPREFATTDNYKRAQSNFFDHLRLQGYDSWIPEEQGGMIAVALRDPTQVKSIYNRTFDPKQKRMDKAPGGPAISKLRQMSDPAVKEAIRVINKSGSSPRDAVTLSKRLLGRQ